MKGAVAASRLGACGFDPVDVPHFAPFFDFLFAVKMKSVVGLA